MDAQEVRKQRGLEMAERFKVLKKGDAWSVPSSTLNGRYTVRITEEFESCNCPDFELRGQRCKHLFCVEHVIQRELQFEVEADGSVTETETVTTVVKRKTYAQNWPVYNEAQTKEKEVFQKLLADLCSRIEEPEQKTGRPRLPLRDVVFSAIFKVYSTFSGRRFMTDLREAHEQGLVSKTPHYNSTFRYLENATLEPILKSLVTLTSLPLKACETKYAVDSSGFSTCKFVRWFSKKYGHEQDNRMWVKAHLMTGVNTNVVTSVEITDWLAFDGPIMPGLVEDTAKNFTVNEVAADKAYSSQRNLQVVTDIGATPYIPFKCNATGESGGLWAKCFHYFNLHRDEFLTHYHVRSNAETTFSMIKRTLGDSLRSKTDTAMKNELLCKIICHNIRCLVMAIFELGINPTFGAEVAPALKVVS